MVSPCGCGIKDHLNTAPLTKLNRTGPIIRINPHEISIDDPDYYDEVYVAGSKRRTQGYSHFGQGIDFEGEHADDS